MTSGLRRFVLPNDDSGSAADKMSHDKALPKFQEQKCSFVYLQLLPMAGRK